MNRIMLTLAAAMTMSPAACAQDKGEKNMQTGNKALVVYFSATGTTAKAARTIAEVTGGTLYEIVPQQAYSSDDLDWNDRQSRSSVEMNDPQARPALKDAEPDVAACDVIFIGYPVWWDQAPRIINTFIESHDLNGKTLVPFATSGGSGITGSVRELKRAYPELEWQDGRLLNGASRNTVQNWVNDVMKRQRRDAGDSRP
ncbi:MAG: flavodoxin [Bacteroides sp. CAG:1060_57_27]|nr:MAG: flavodoxin [Bacteroides sp. CAG:1060_57_27]